MDTARAHSMSSEISPTSRGGKMPSESDLDRWLDASTLKTELISLCNSFSRLEKDLNENTHISRIAQLTLQQSKGSIIRLATRLDELTNRVPINSRPTASSAKAAQQLFDVSELLEKILLHCAFEDLLSVQSVSRTFAKAVSSSAKIQERLGLRPAVNGSPWSPLGTAFFIRRGCIVRLEEVNPFVFDSNDISLIVSLNTFGHATEVLLPRLGSRLRRMLICQPPINSMRIRASESNIQYTNLQESLWADSTWKDCCEQDIDARSARRRSDRRRLPEIRSATGITLGDILDTTGRLREEHRYCPDAFEGLHREDGSVDVHVDFEASLPLQPQDPLLIARQKAKDDYAQMQRQIQAKSESMAAYVAAKRAARDAGRPIPTLAQFNAEQSHNQSIRSNTVQTPARP